MSVVSVSCLCPSRATGSDAVLGHVTKRDQGVPPSQQIRRMKHSPGSGVLSVEVKSDGPTRTLRITDENRKVVQ